MDFEKKLTRMESIVENMENSDTSLEDSIKLFEEGVQLSRDCHKQLSEAEQKVKVLLSADQSGNAETKDFQTEGA
ncbi:MAG: exodeoxyribonuclease VII small subunit [Bdellovibrionaceae bacterium]|jgi:exodeoxyribonuclease VII small subunit|nr:exodeoxyribonuclease VII small subunit [Pseudobdellovibrionaceae bacterium]